MAEDRPGKCLDVVSSSTASGALVQLFPCTTYNNQKWQKVSASGGYQWRNVNSNLCLAVDAASTAQGARMVQLACNANAQSQVIAWSGTSLVIQHNKQCVDIYGGSTANGAQVIQWPCHGGSNQQFSER